MARKAIYSLNLCLRSDTSSPKLNIILTLLLGFDIDTTGGSETGGSLSKKRDRQCYQQLTTPAMSRCCAASNIMLLL